MASANSGSGLFRFLRPRLRPQPVDFTAAAAWGVAGVTGALWIVQHGLPLCGTLQNCSKCRICCSFAAYDTREMEMPFDWLKQQFFGKPEQ